MSELLREFLTEWLATAERDGDLAPAWFNTGTGLCHCLEGFLMDHTEEEAEATYFELKDAFRSDGLDPLYPFGEDAYDECMRDNMQHTDPKRLAWVRKQLEA